MLWAEVPHKLNLHLLCREAHFKHYVTRVPLTCRVCVYKVSPWRRAPAQCNCVLLSWDTPANTSSEPQFHSGFPVWVPTWLCAQRPSPLSISKQLKTSGDITWWRGEAQGWLQNKELEIPFFSIAVHFPVVLGKLLNFSHSYPLVQRRIIIQSFFPCWKATCCITELKRKGEGWGIIMKTF